jgi:hypothetical protein
MEQKDIDRLLAGRKIIDEIKSPDPVVLSALNAKTKKTESVSLSTVKQTLAERDALLKIEGDSIVNAEKQLVELGFAGIGDFMSFNEKMCFDAFKECRPVQGFCDLCKGNLDAEGKETGMMCKNLTGQSLCEKDVEERNTEVLLDFIYRNTFRHIEMFGVSIYKRKGNISRGVCPEGHGFYVDENLCKPFPFTLFWRGFEDKVYPEVFVNEIKSNLDAEGKWKIYQQELISEGTNSKDKK